MKKLLPLLSLLFIANIAMAITPPAAVEKAFQKKFPTVTKVYWENEDHNEWEAEFKMDKKKYTASFTSEGAWVITEGEIEISELPVALKKEILNKYPESTFLEVYKIESAKKEIFYEAKIKTPTKKRKVFITSDGVFVKSMLK